MELAKLKRPRPVMPLQASAGLVVGGVFWALMSVIVSIVAAWVFSRDFGQYSRFVHEGVTVTGTVVKLEVDDSGDSTSYYVQYQYVAPVSAAAVSFSDRVSVSAGFFGSLKTEQPIEIIFLPGDPAVSVIATQLEPPSLVGLTTLEALIGVSLLGGLVLIGVELRRRHQIRRLRECGQQTQAVVFDRWMTKDSEGNPSYFAAFVFQIPAAQGGPRTITRAKRNQGGYDQCRVGDALTVEYLAEKPSVCRVRLATHLPLGRGDAAQRSARPPVVTPQRQPLPRKP